MEKAETVFDNMTDRDLSTYIALCEAINFRLLQQERYFLMPTCSDAVREAVLGLYIKTGWDVKVAFGPEDDRWCFQTKPKGL